MAAMPSATVTFLFTDIEVSTRSWEDHPAAMRAGVERHDAIVRGAVVDHGEYVLSTAGDQPDHDPGMGQCSVEGDRGSERHASEHGPVEPESRHGSGEIVAVSIRLCGE